MKKVLIKYGAISGILVIGLMLLSLTLSLHSAIVGYALMIVSFSVIFFAVRAYYNDNPEIKITFLKSLSIGLLITLIASVVYVIVWLIMYYTVFPDFWDKYGAGAIDKLRKSGASSAEIIKETETIKEYKEMYKNPLINAAFTFIEPLPVGILISLISAAVIRKRK